MLTALLLLALNPDAGAPPDAGVPEWTLAQKLKPGSELRKALVKELLVPQRHDGGTGEAALTQEEADALLDDPRAQAIYGEKTVSIVAPSMITKQRKDHLDLMALFLKKERVEAGEKFLTDKREVFERTTAKTGVDPFVITGILTWESKLGTITGEFKAFNVFTSQAYFIDEANEVALARAGEKKLLAPEDQKARVERIRERARRNLVVLVRQCKGKGIDVLEVKGSWAGALGFPQFMPDSLRWADDGDGDGKIDLFTMDDSIASIGRYLKAHGYEKSRKEAVWGYNHEAAYVEGVLAFADMLARRTAKDLEPFLVPGVFEPGTVLVVDPRRKETKVGEVAPPDEKSLAALEAKLGPLPADYRGLMARHDGGNLKIPIDASQRRSLFLFRAAEALDHVGDGLVGVPGALPIGNDNGEITLFIDTKNSLGRGAGAVWSHCRPDGPARETARLEGATLVDVLRHLATGAELLDRPNGLAPVRDGGTPKPHRK